MKRNNVRTAVLLLVNGFVAWWLLKLTIEQYSILSVRNAVLTGIAVLVLSLGIVLDWLNPKLGCAWNIAIWCIATVLQAWVASHAEWAEQKIGFLLALAITLFICLVYFLGRRDAKRRTA